jgi:glycosyltransferase involved in cell wall biosynthesis
VPDTAVDTSQTPEITTMPIAIRPRPVQPLPARRLIEGLGRWPFVAPAVNLPPTLPGGRPWPKISIITPSFNQGRYIEETILSIQRQGYPDVEHIIMDGGSTDETMEVVEKYRDGIAIAVSEKDKGQSDAINKGFARATGEICTWLNSDDMLAPGALASAAMAFATSGADMVNGICQVYKDGRLTHQCTNSNPDGPIPLRDLLDVENCWMSGQFWWQPDCFFTKELWDRAGGHVRVDWYYSMDYELWLRFAEAGAKLHTIGRPVCWFRTHEEQKTSEAGGGGFRGELPKAAADFCATRGIELEPRTLPAVKQRLKVVFFNDYGWHFGAGIGHRRIAEAFASAGHGVACVAAARARPWMERPQLTTRDIVAKIAAHKPDLVVVGNLHGAGMRAEVLDAIARRFETAFLMHDLWLLTGRGTYIGDCACYKDGDTARCTCPAAYPKLAKELERPQWELKRRITTGARRFSIFANSNWTRDRAAEAVASSRGSSADLGRQPGIEAVKLGLDIDTFKPRDKALCREMLGLDPEEFIIMASSASLEDDRKGLRYLAAAMAKLELSDARVIGVGWFPEGQDAPIPGMKALGYIDAPEQLALLYSAADLFVGPSVEEAFGMVFLEAAACGTPSIGFRVGGVPEAITHGVTGLVAPEVSANALADAIRTLYLDDELRAGMSRWARIHIENEWSLWSGYHRIHTALRASGAGDRIGLSRKIDFTRPAPVPEPEYVSPTMPPYEPVIGFGAVEGPAPKQNLGRFRWMLGPRAIFHLHSDFRGPGRVLIECRTPHDGQRLRLLHEQTIVSEQPLPAGRERSVMLSYEVRAGKGRNLFELHAWKWAPGDRPLAAQIVSINLVPEA